MRAETYPGADTSSQWFANRWPGDRFDANNAVVHTTEGTGWPSYAGGSMAPTMTGRPNFAKKRLDWRQHFPVDMSARALVNRRGGVETNTLNAFQVELVGTCDPRTRDRWVTGGLKQDQHFIYWPEAPAWAMRSLAELVLWLEREHGIPAKGPEGKTWQAYPASYGTTNPNRFTGAEWDKHYGWAGHSHVPENEHGDPGALPFDTVLAYVAAMKIGPGTSAPAGVDPKPTRRKTVTVWAGATLSAIAVAAGVTLPQLLGSNPQITDPGVIHPGDTVTLPADADPVTPPASAPTPTAKPAPAKPAPARPASTTRALSLNDRGADVTRYEGCLVAAGLLDPRWGRDGYFGTTTRTATNTLIRRHPGLGAADGVAGPLTQKAACAEPKVGTRIFRYETRGADVLSYERCLAADGLLSSRWVDGYFGTETVRGTDVFVRRHPRLLPADGTAGPLTQRAVCS